MSYLLDTNVISELVASRPEPKLLNWLGGVDEDALFISVVSIAEIRYGVDIMAVGKRRNLLETWITNDLSTRFAGRILDIDTAAASVWGNLTARRKSLGRVIGTMDAFIAATAKRHNLTLVTRNIADFTALDLNLFNPWES